MIGGQQELLSGRLNYVSGMQIMYESTGIMSYGSGWVVGKQMICITILKVCVDFVEVVLGVHDANAPDFTTWFDYDGVVISKVV